MHFALLFYDETVCIHQITLHTSLKKISNCLMATKPMHEIEAPQ